MPNRNKAEWDTPVTFKKINIYNLQKEAVIFVRKMKLTEKGKPEITEFSPEWQLNWACVEYLCYEGKKFEKKIKGPTHDPQVRQASLQKIERLYPSLQKECEQKASKILS